MKKPELEEARLRFHPRVAETVTISIPVDTLDSLRKEASERDMSVEALVKFYIGQGLRQADAWRPFFEGLALFPEDFIEDGRQQPTEPQQRESMFVE